ncbi:MAG: hypothetical protein CVV25_13965 [Ignavibacteriae bacterium HGW-Ignavibacteriae-4]|jgi:surface protein|nr:MAG: hypothetical protein CVV25_13965 [Ignavibacteriae bacterium HGW-Ignavibacteriae-4]
MKKIIIIVIALLFSVTTLMQAQIGMMMGRKEKVLPFISTWVTSAPNESITLPLLSSGGQYDFVVDWGDGNIETITTNSAIHNYATASTQTITISGLINGWKFNGSGDKDKITDISQWGCLKGAGNAAFYNCRNLQVSATDIFNTEGITDFSDQFALCTSLTNLDVSNWDMSSGIEFDYQFYGCQSLTSLNVAGWDVSSGTDFSSQFQSCNNLTTLDVSGWDVSSGTYFFAQFANCSSLTGLDVSGWDVSSGTYFGNFMSFGPSMTTPIYNQTLINWKDKLQSSPTFTDIDFGGSQYNLAPNPAAAARADIETLGWTITDGGGI